MGESPTAESGDLPTSDMLTLHIGPIYGIGMETPTVPTVIVPYLRLRPDGTLRPTYGTAYSGGGWRVWNLDTTYTVGPAYAHRSTAARHADVRNARTQTVRFEINGRLVGWTDSRSESTIKRLALHYAMENVGQTVDIARD